MMQYTLPITVLVDQSAIPPDDDEYFMVIRARVRASLKCVSCMVPEQKSCQQ